MLYPTFLSDPTACSEGQEAPRAHGFPSPTVESNLNGRNPWIRLLDGFWLFHYAENPAQRPIDFYQPNFSCQTWGTIRVPANIELEGYGYPIYVNDRYPFPKNPPFAPTDFNPVGSYRTTFKVPDDWGGLEVFIHFGSISGGSRFWLNGHYLGYNTDGKTPIEFRLTNFLQPGENILCVEVFRWSAGSYLECQDFWRISGIERSVTLWASPPTRIQDFFIRPTLLADNQHGELAISLAIERPCSSNSAAPAYQVQLELFDESSKIFEFKKFEKTLTEEIKILNEDKTLAIDIFEGLANAGAIAAWNTAAPKLYSCRLSLLDAAGQLISLRRCHIGFRRVSIENTQLRLNGEVLTIRGVNRHEHDEHHGRVITEATMLQDLQLMKALHINAVRNSHYPNCERWYELCDEYGMLLVDEANIESHGMGYGEESLAKDPRWEAAHLERLQRMFERTKNHASVIIWSLGNEAGSGRNFEACAAWLRQKDPSRPLQYEQAFEEAYTDIVCPMYPSPAALEAYALKHPYRPLIMCEYAHAMGNSLGSLADYWKIIRQHDCLQGGFIWDWVDQGLAAQAADGRKYWTFGGDYGPEGVPSDNNFCINGLVFPDRSPHPMIEEVRKVYQSIQCNALDLSIGLLEIVNTDPFGTHKYCRLQWTWANELSTLAKGELFISNLAANSQQRIELGTSFRSETESWLNVSVFSTEDRPLLAAGHLLGQEQFVLGSHCFAELIPLALQPDENLTATIEYFTLDAGSAQFIIDRQLGLICQIKYRGQYLLRSPIRPNFWRAPVDNDFGWKMPEWCKPWHKLSQSLDLKSIEQLNNSVLCTFTSKEVAVEIQLTYMLMEGGAVGIRYRFKPLVANLPPLPRLGLHCTLNDAFEQATYYGKGPFENYPDRCEAAQLGVYTMAVAAGFEPYISPQECGNREATRQLVLQQTRQAIQLSIVASEAFGFSLGPYSPEQLSRTHRGSLHTIDLPPSAGLSLCLDAAQMGIGGIDSWLSPPLATYWIPLEEKTIDFYFRLGAEDLGSS